MNQTENQKQKQSLSQFIESKLVRKLTQLLLSVSVFSLFFSHSYWLSLFHSFNSTFHDTLAFKFFSHNIDKNFIFLLCNGLLVFLAKYSGLLSSLSKHNHSDDHQSFKSYELYVPQTEPTRLDPETPLLEKEVALETTAEALENSSVMEEEEEEENAGFVEEDEDGLKGSIEESESYEPEEEEEIIMEENQVLSTEELNKKFDEFIRKMKEELRIEARQQLVMV
ncbi:hypothetical protein like AT3G13130 [Hibiscus trionum]|uniref:Transmembrane protein n=1 Tax=Hibiscus trionum TaxID=183268 RepID=A0A9W7MS61_HIBTR|nr:hypothetical protein like AT3G13130 [Hibiscus trionum]